MATEAITTISPSTNKPVLTRHAPSPQEISQLPHLAQTAFASFRRSHPNVQSRQDIVAKALQTLGKRQGALAKELTIQMGRPIAYTTIEITTAVKRGEYLNKIAAEVLEVDTPGEKEDGFKRYIRKGPVGVVLIIFAWNVCLHRLFLSMHAPDFFPSIPTSFSSTLLFLPCSPAIV